MLEDIKTRQLGVYFYLRNRNTMVQVKNTSSTDQVNLHVKIFSDGFINLRSVLFLDPIGFAGLNDGAGRGSMDRFKTVREPLQN